MKINRKDFAAKVFAQLEKVDDRYIREALEHDGQYLSHFKVKDMTDDKMEELGLSALYQATERKVFNTLTDDVIADIIASTGGDLEEAVTWSVSVYLENRIALPPSFEGDFYVTHIVFKS